MSHTERHAEVLTILAASTLPESKGVNHDDICGTNDGISSAVRKLVPAVGSANLDAGRQLGLDGLDLALELLASEVSAVKSLGANGDGVNGVGVLLRNVGNSFKVLIEGFLNIGPGSSLLAKSP
jgi:hypothetical protein